MALHIYVIMLHGNKPVSEFFSLFSTDQNLNKLRLVYSSSDTTYLVHMRALAIHFVIDRHDHHRL